jgi:polyketide biosynthesis acyl carrier protein
MTRDDVLRLVRARAAAVLPDADLDRIDPDASLADLGASSLDRMDIVVASQEELGISVPAEAFAEVRNLGQLVEVLHAHCG